MPARAGYRRCPFGCGPVAPPLRAPWCWLWRWRAWAAGGFARIRWLGWGFSHFGRSLYALLAAWPVGARGRWLAVGLGALGLLAVGAYWARVGLLTSPSGTDQEVSRQVVFVYRNAEGIHEAPFGSGQAVRLTSQDDYRIVVRPVAPYVYILQQQGGSYWRLFPHEGWSPGLRNPLLVGVEAVFPSRSAWYCLDEAVGEETVHVVMSQAPIAELESLPEAGEAGLRVGSLGRLIGQASWVRYRFEHAQAVGGGVRECAPAPGRGGAGAG